MYQPLDSDLTTWAGITPGTGIGTALAVNVGTDGAPVIKGGALGTPSGGTLTSCTIKCEYPFACSDQTSDISAGAAKFTFRITHAMTLTGVHATMTSAPTGSTAIFDILNGGSTIFSTKLSIDASEKSSNTAFSAAVISSPSIAAFDEISVNFDQIGSTNPGKGVVITLIGTRS